MGYEVECYGKITTRELELKEINKLFLLLVEKDWTCGSFGGCNEEDNVDLDNISDFYEIKD